ncbi:MAG: hypothetical protein J6T39_00730, partial [Clostridia bacterium]|nr:hypothetical protein [Clostridia bacterium]
LPVNLFMVYTTFVGIENNLQIFFKQTHSRMLMVILFVIFDYAVISTVLAIFISLFYLIGLAVPVLYSILIIMLWRYCNYDSKQIKATITNKYLGVGISNHYVFDGVDILSEKNYQKVEHKPIKMFNPFNPSFAFDSEQLLYVNGKDFKFYIATRKINEIYTLIFLARNKDAIRYKLNKDKKKDFEMNKNICIAYSKDEPKKEEGYVYIENKLRYKFTPISPTSEKINVEIQQKTELPHLTSKNIISNWFGDSFDFPSRAEADMFVKYVVEETKKGALDNEF